MRPTITIETLPCPVCGERPLIISYLGMARRRKWSCACRNKCHATRTFLECDYAVLEWNAWADGEDYDEDEDEEDDETDAGGVFDEQRYSRVCRLLEEALTLMSEWGT